ncbi:unnamed protein product [Miscanthus lutarioriparius]|uniref:Glycosyltransferase 61 catalytic domain-containing protein n=1 Tax=Miscanthus lutarioriparius TaxID=422564 RepID=A0A811P359_9POAL|nr:unnamed protein product [Miscanthus lutarioriparius]
MAFLVQHGKSRSRGVGARKPRHSARSSTKLELRHRQLAVRLLAACLLAPVLCICAARLLSVVLPSQLSSGNGVYPAEGNHVISDDAEAAAGALTSLQRAFVDDGHRLQEPSAPVPARLGADPVRGSPELDIEVESSNSNHITDLDNKSGMKGLTISSTNASSPPENSLMSSRRSVTDIEVPKPKSKIYCDDKSKDEGFPYARPIICHIISHDVPAVIFSVGGYTGNFFHDMSDVLIPLYLTSFQYKGRVKFFMTNYKQWWVQKYKPVLRRLSHHDIIDFGSNKDVHCFQHVILGLTRDRDLILGPHPTRNPKGYSMLDFTRFLRHSYGLKRDRPLVLGEQPGKKPRMLIISRRGTRKLLNLRQVSATSRALGFDVIVSEARGNLKRFATMVNSCDVLLAVHGAGLTNQVFLPPQAVVIQIVPWGKMDWMATNFYGQPARGMNLRYLEYYVSEQESSLAQRYPRDHLVFKDPMAIHGQGWNALADIFMAQDVKLNIRRFRPILLQVLDLLQV